MVDFRIGIVGCGLIGQQYAVRLGSLGAYVSAVADPMVERAQAVAEISGAASYNDVHDLLAEEEIDLLCVCSPTHFHFEAVMAAAGHRRTSSARNPWRKTCSKARKCAARAKSMIEAGAIGQPLYSIFSYFQQVPPPERIWYRDFGAARDNIVHAIDLSNWLLDRGPLQATARLDNRLGFKGEDKVF